MTLSRQVPLLEQWIDAQAQAGRRFAVLGDFNRRISLEQGGARAADGRQLNLWAEINDADPPGAALTAVTLAGPFRKCVATDEYDSYIDLVVLGKKLARDIVPDSFQRVTYRLDDCRRRRAFRSLSGRHRAAAAIVCRANSADGDIHPQQVMVGNRDTRRVGEKTASGSAARRPEDAAAADSELFRRQYVVQPQIAAKRSLKSPLSKRRFAAMTAIDARLLVSGLDGASATWREPGCSVRIARAGVSAIDGRRRRIHRRQPGSEFISPNNMNGLPGARPPRRWRSSTR